jgi:GntR family transcriptional regulator/MocR family aminotransferase
MLDTHLPVPLYKQLYERIRMAILSGQMERGERLPSTRQLASELGVSRTTAVLAYEHLSAEGYLESQVGQGTVVARQLPATPFFKQHEKRPEQPADPRLLHSVQVASHVPSLQQVLSPFQVEGGARETSRGHASTIDRFPYNVWARLLARRARQSLREFAYYQSPAGYLPLREAIATQISITRGVVCTPEQVIITTGAQGAIDIAVRTLLNAGDAAWFENPGYVGARGALLSAGANLVAVPVDEQGLDVAYGRQRCPNAKLVWTTPSHQFPTGVTMSLARRRELLQWVREADAWILEDDYESEYRWNGRPLEAIQGLDHTGRVLYIGTFSKTLFPALRLGYLVAPLALLEPLLATRHFIDINVHMLEQMALYDFLREGYYVRYLCQMREYYRLRREVLSRALHTHLSSILTVHTPDVGMRLVGWLAPGKEDGRAAALAAEVGVDVTPLSRYSLEPLPRGGLLFGFGSASTEEEVLLGVKRLASALTHL